MFIPRPVLLIGHWLSRAMTIENNFQSKLLGCTMDVSWPSARDSGVQRRKNSFAISITESCLMLTGGAIDCEGEDRAQVTALSRLRPCLERGDPRDLRILFSCVALELAVLPASRADRDAPGQ